jgi:hypothetical protein
MVFCTINIIKEYITIIITSSLVSSIVSSIINGVQNRKSFIFEKKQEAFTNIINQVSSFINDIPYSKDLNEFFQISGNSYINFKLEIEKYVLYLDKNDYSVLDEILDVFANNINQDDVWSYNPNDPDYKVFSVEDRKQIIKLKDKLLLSFKYPSN